MAVTALSRESAEKVLEFCARRCSKRASLSPAAARLALYPAQTPPQALTRCFNTLPGGQCNATEHTASLLQGKLVHAPDHSCLTPQRIFLPPCMLKAGLLCRSCQ